jgi:shikimate kinase
MVGAGIMMDDNTKRKIISKLNEVQEEILIIGWDGIMQKYHPDANLDDPEASNIFKLYKHIYQSMKQRITIQQDANIGE